jgi:glycosyltransferase involved in cell wall biosynthesis
VNNNRDITIFIHAINVHNGGGKSLLNALLSELPAGQQAVALLDTRMILSGDIPPTLNIKRIKPNIFHRLSAEFWLRIHVRLGDTALCFGNLPPLFRLHGQAILYLQNRYLIDPVRLENFPARIRLRIFLERIWLKCRVSNVDTLLVQTPSMQSLALKFLSNYKNDIQILPFVGKPFGYKRRLDVVGGENVGDFMYVATGDPHKNHFRLIESWCMLASEGLYPRLWLTLDDSKHADLNLFIQEKSQNFNLHIYNLGVLAYDEVQQHYKKVDALIYPSTFESFGLPLIEARQAGLAVIAAELDYVRDILDPDESFDPFSAISIARAVKRFMSKIEDPLPIESAASFLKKIIESNTKGTNPNL